MALLIEILIAPACRTKGWETRMGIFFLKCTIVYTTNFLKGISKHVPVRHDQFTWVFSSETLQLGWKSVIRYDTEHWPSLSVIIFFRFQNIHTLKQHQNFKSFLHQSRHCGHFSFFLLSRETGPLHCSAQSYCKEPFLQNISLYKFDVRLSTITWNT